MALTGNKREIGNNASILLGDEQFPITNASYSEEADVSEVSFNQDLSQTIAVTSVSYSGSFEHSGSNRELRDALFTEQGGGELGRRTAIPQVIDNLYIKDSENSYNFKNVLISSRSKDFPSDDRTSASYDFMCEKVIVTERNRGPLPDQDPS
jgi:hypothetical protein